MIALTTQIEQHQLANQNAIYTNSTIINQLNLPLDQPLSLIVGNKKLEVTVVLSSHKGDLLRIPSHIAKELCIPNGIRLYAKYNQETGLQLGPFFGILVQSIQSNQPNTPFGKLTHFLQEVNQVAHSNGALAYVFTLSDIDEQAKCVTGYTYRNNRWIKGSFPIPHAVYNRISSRSNEKKLTESINHYKQKYHFSFFNEHFLNKWQVYQLLNPTPIKSIMPRTTIYQGVLSLKEMLSHYPVVYVKPTNGALGRGIIKIERKQKQYIVKFSKMQGAKTLKFRSIGSLFKQLKPRLSSESYLIQQGLSLIHLNHRPIDFRILTQKNNQGKWAVTSMVARIAEDQNIVSNLARGGTQSGVIQTIRIASPTLAKKLNKAIFKKLALSVAKHLETSSNGHFAELGIDLALDSSGKVWLIEVNAKPSKTDDPTSVGPRPSVYHLLQYVFYTSGFQSPFIKKRKGRKPIKKRGR